MMEFIIYFGIAVIAISFIALGISLWALITHREKKYVALLNEHIAQKSRLQVKFDRKDNNYQ